MTRGQRAVRGALYVPSHTRMRRTIPRRCRATASDARGVRTSKRAIPDARILATQGQRPLGNHRRCVRGPTLLDDRPTTKTLSHSIDAGLSELALCYGLSGRLPLRLLCSLADHLCFLLHVLCG